MLRNCQLDMIYKYTIYKFAHDRTEFYLPIQIWFFFLYYICQELRYYWLWQQLCCKFVSVLSILNHNHMYNLPLGYPKESFLMINHFNFHINMDIIQHYLILCYAWVVLQLLSNRAHLKSVISISNSQQI